MKALRILSIGFAVMGGAVASLCLSWPGTTLAADEASPANKPAKTHQFKFKKEWTWAKDAGQFRALEHNVGKPAKPLTVGPWVGDEPPALAALKGKIVLVDFWATWCGPCKAAVPHTNEVMSKYRERGVVVLGVCNTRQGPGSSTMADVAQKTGMKYPTALDRNDQTAGAYGVIWWPFYVIVDRQGMVRAVGLRPDAIETALDDLLNEQPN